MLTLVMVTIVAVTVAVGALQNGQAVTVSFFFWQFQAPLALVILLAAAAGLLGGALVHAAHAARGWRQRAATARNVAPPAAVVPDPPAGATSRMRLPR